MRSVDTKPSTVLVQLLAGTFGSVPAHTPARRLLMIFGLAKPTDTWKPAGPYSWKKLGSPTRRNESWAFWPSSVLVCSHSSPRSIRSAAGVATTPYRPGIRLATTAWPAIGDSVAPSLSYFGQVTISPVMPFWLASPLSTLPVIIGEIGQASRPVAGSMVPASEFDSG